MKISLISGSSRKDSQSLKITQWLDNHLKEMEVVTEIVDLQKLELPIRHEDIWEDVGKASDAKSLRVSLESADGYVVVSPEWHGMASPALKNMFLYVQHTMAHKPALLTTVSAVRGGAYPVAELRMSSYKNTFINYIPDNLIIRGVNDMFNSNSVTEGEKDDQYMKQRAVYSLKVLIEYTNALQNVRASDALDYKTYATGM